MIRAILVGAGEVDRAGLAGAIVGAEVLIGVDGGAGALEACDCRPDWIVGDLDSLDPAVLERLRSRGTQVRQYPRAKDQTDLENALALAAELGANEIEIFGATGSRLDHTLTNLALLRQAGAFGLAARLRAPGQEIRLLAQGAHHFRGCPGQGLSLVPLTEQVNGVSTSGLRFPLDQETLHLGESRGVHNEFLEEEATVTVGAGELLAFLLDPDLT